MKKKVFKVAGKILMNFLKFGLMRISISVFLFMLFIFSSCQDDEFDQNFESDFGNHWENVSFDNISSIDSLPFSFSEIGVLHNSLMSLYADNIDNLFDIENNSVKLTLNEFLEFNYERSLVLLDGLGIDMCFSKEDYIRLSREIIESQANNPPLFLTPEERIEQLKFHYPSLAHYFDDFRKKVFDPIHEWCLEDVSEVLSKLANNNRKIKTKVLDSKLYDIDKVAMLSFLIVFENSIEQILFDFHQEDHPLYDFYFGEYSKDGAFWIGVGLADAGGAVKGAIAGAAGGPAGALALGFGNGAFSSLCAAGVGTLSQALAEMLGW